MPITVGMFYNKSTYDASVMKATAASPRSPSQWPRKQLAQIAASQRVLFPNQRAPEPGPTGLQKDS
jgi:hypothetical protein